jgi:hypothetical protein
MSWLGVSHRRLQLRGLLGVPAAPGGIAACD